MTELTTSGLAGSNVIASWIRRTRVDGDNWDMPEVPLGETAELYTVRVYLGAALKREVQVTSPSWTYLPTDQMADGVSGAFTLSVAQVSDRYGNGPFVQASVA